MKKVMIISYYFPPMRYIGARRPFGLAKYLPKFGWEPTVLTVRLPGIAPNGIRVIQTEYKDIPVILKAKLGMNPQKGIQEQLGIAVSKNYSYPTLKSKIIKFVKEIISFPDDNNGWYKYAVKSASEILDREHMDAIISTSYPVTAHLIARTLHNKYEIPWIADLRDLWTQNHYYRKSSFIKFFERGLEIKTLSDADLLVTANPHNDELAELHKNKKVVCVISGYDEEEFSNAPCSLSDKFTLTYTGILYNGKRDPSMLFKVIKRLIDERMIDRRLIEVNFYGCSERWLYDEVERYKLSEVVNVNGAIPREDVLKVQRKSQILLLLLWGNANEERLFPGKLFEYLGTRRPIIAFGGKGGVVSHLLERTRAGKFAIDEGHLERILLEYYQDFLKSGEVKYHCNQNVRAYTSDHMAEKYAELLHELISV